MNIVHLCTSDSGGGAQAAIRLHKALLPQGIHSTFFSKYRGGTHIPHHKSMRQHRSVQRYLDFTLEYYILKGMVPPNRHYAEDTVICEYNDVFGNNYPLTIPYDANFIRSKAHPSCIYFGASIKALMELGSKLDYIFLGSNLNGSNGFFIRQNKFTYLENKIVRITSYPSQFREARSKKGKLIYLSGLQRLSLIDQLPIVDLRTDSLIRVNDMGSLYTQDWLE